MTSVKHIFLFFLLFPSSAIMMAQFPTGGAPGGSKGGFSMPNIGRLYGKIQDAKTKEPVEFASVALFVFDKDSVLAGVLAKSNGDFSLDNLPAMGAFRLKISFIGYKPIEQKIFINPQKIEQDLGNIKLEPDEALLNEVTITGEKSTFTMSIDRKIYNVDKDISVRGGTALDVMKNVPSVNVDVDGNATLRNSATQIYVDGRPTALTLAQIPADQIDRVEVITNPSVKFDAGTTGGILNIVMKKNTKPGYNGMVMGGIGSSNSDASPNRYNGMGNFNIKENPFNFSLMYNYNTQQNLSKGFTKRTDRSNGVDYGNYEQNNLTDMSNTFQFGRLAIDYYVNNRNTLTLSENIVSGKFNTLDKQDFTQNYSIAALPGYFGNKVNDQRSGFTNYTTQLQYKRTYPKQGQEWTADLNHNYTSSAFENHFNTDRFDLASGNAYSSYTDRQIIKGGTEASQFTFQTDYVNPINEYTKIEFGARSYYKKSSNVSNASYMITPETEVKDSFNSNHYSIDDMVNAAYINYTGKKWGIGYQAGLRFEQSYYAGTITDKNQHFSYSYPSGSGNIMKSLFPGIYLSKKFQHNQEVQMNFSRKINRPNFFQLMPYIMFADLKNIRIGNPQLTPEFINKAEINYNVIKGKTNFLSSGYFNYTESPITNMS
ncbi:MAG: outer membrane beta-barrel protein, partial [Bacteroidia bacterium]